MSRQIYKIWYSNKIASQRATEKKLLEIKEELEYFIKIHHYARICIIGLTAGISFGLIMWAIMQKK